MGANSSDTSQEEDNVSTSKSFLQQGWRVFCVFPNSPTSHLGIIPYFHVLSHIRDVEINNISSQSELIELLRESEGKSVEVGFTHIGNGSLKKANIIPNSKWGGPGMLGMMIHHDQLSTALMDSIHVIQVSTNSPASKAGLIEEYDYLLGSREVSFKGYNELDWWIERIKPGDSSTLFVFNAKTYTVREVLITPNKSWGGEGSLGFAKLGTGYLHKLPLKNNAEEIKLVTQEQHVQLFNQLNQESEKANNITESKSRAGPGPNEITLELNITPNGEQPFILPISIRL